MRVRLSASDWLGTVIQDVDVTPINEQLMKLLGGCLMHNPELLHGRLDGFGLNVARPTLMSTGVPGRSA